MRNHGMVKIFLSVVLASSALCANAVPIVWELQDAVFSDGGTASGTFTVDVDTQSIFDVSITTTAGSDPATFPGATFLGGNISALFDGDGLVGLVMSMTNGGFTQSFGMAFITDMGFGAPLNNAGGSAVLYEGETFEEICSIGGLDCAVRFMDIGGRVVSVPEPGLLGLLFVGSLGLCISRRKQQKGNV